MYGQLLCRNVKRFREGLVFEAHGLLYHSTLDWRVIKKKMKVVTKQGGVGTTLAWILAIFKR